jgi:hypothetical protein
MDVDRKARKHVTLESGDPRRISRFREHEMIRRLQRYTNAFVLAALKYAQCTYDRRRRRAVFASLVDPTTRFRKPHGQDRFRIATLQTDTVDEIVSFPDSEHVGGGTLLVQLKRTADRVRSETGASLPANAMIQSHGFRAVPIHPQQPQTMEQTTNTCFVISIDIVTQQTSHTTIQTRLPNSL